MFEIVTLGYIYGGLMDTTAGIVVIYRYKKVRWEAPHNRVSRIDFPMS